MWATNDRKWGESKLTHAGEPGNRRTLAAVEAAHATIEELEAASANADLRKIVVTDRIEGA